MVSGLGSSFCRLVDGPASRDLSDDDFFDRRVTDFLLANSGSVNLTLDIRLMRRQMANIESFTGCRIVDWRSLPEHSVSSRSEEHTSELQSLMRISYAVFCLKKKKNKTEANSVYQ